MHQDFFRDFLPFGLLCWLAVADFLRDFFFAPEKIRSQPFENFSVDPVWTVYPVIGAVLFPIVEIVVPQRVIIVTSKLTIPGGEIHTSF